MFESHATSTDSRQIRVFLSSTFVDFMEERELLVKRVFPALNRRARDRGVELIDVDLRWGVTEEQTKQGLTLPLCLGEIDRCRPYFIGLLGERHGWVPPADFYKPELLERQPWLKQLQGGASVTELEILHGVLRNPEMAGYARFYLRDPAYALAKNDQTWLAEGEEERQRLRALKEKVRASGFPVVEGLANPEAIASRIEADLWELIEERFREQEQPDALEQENRKHASYRHSRTGEGQYVGGGSYIEQLEAWIQADEQQILITGPSGSGKSALLANWMAAHAQAHPEDVVYAHHLGCTNDTNAPEPMLARLIQNASRLLLNEKIITEELVIPQNWWDLVAKIAETLQDLSRWCQKTERRWIWVLDGLDRLNPDDQNALPWLPQNLPAGIHVMASALACRARNILSDRGYPTVTIEGLQRPEQEKLITQVLGRYTKQLDPALKEEILSHLLAGSPLFLRVLLEELRQCARFETLKEQLVFYLSSQTIDDLYERVLERLENECVVEVVRKVMTAIWASRAGLSETELLEIRDLVQLQWAPIDLALEKAFGRNGNRLVFDHDFLRKAVEDRYLPSEEQHRQAHSELADWYQEREGWDERDSEELPCQLQEAGRLEDLRDWLLKPWALANLQWDRGSRETINYWLVVKGQRDDELDELIADDLEEEIKKRRVDAEDLIWFVDRIAGLFNEAGLYREPLLKLRTLSLELKKASGEGSDEAIIQGLKMLADTHCKLGDYNTALPLYQRCLKANEQLLGPEHHDTLTAVSDLGQWHWAQGNYEQAEMYCKRCLEARERLFGPADPYTVAIIDLYGGIYLSKGDYVQAQSFCQRALEAHEILEGNDHPNTLICVANLGWIYLSMGDLSKAQIFFQRALEAQQRLLGNEHPDSLSTISKLARLYWLQGNKKEAELLYLRCLQRLERVLDFFHPNAFAVISDLGCLYEEINDFEGARNLFVRYLKRLKEDKRSTRLAALAAPVELDMFDKTYQGYIQAKILYETIALEAIERLRGPKHATTGTARLVLGNLLSLQGLNNEAANLLRIELKRCQSSRNVGINETLVIMHGLGTNLLSAEQPQEALDVLQECLSQRQRLLGQTHDDTLSTMARVLEALAAQGRQNDAIVLSQQAYQAIVDVHGDAHPEALTQFSNQAVFHEELGELEQAESLYRRCLQGREQALGADHADTISTAYNLADVLSQQARHAEAIPLRRRELTWCREQNGDTDPGTLASMNALAIDLRKTGAREEAEALFRELLAARQQVLEPSDFGIGRALGGLAKTLEEAGRLEEAAAYRLKALDHRIEHEGPDAWWSNRNRLDLARVLGKLGRNSEALAQLQELQQSMGRNDTPNDGDRELMIEAAELLRVTYWGKTPEA